MICIPPIFTLFPYTTLFRSNSDKLKLLKEFIIIHQLLKKDFNQFYLRLFNLEIQSECVIFMKDYHTRLLKSLQNLMNQHDCRSEEHTSELQSHSDLVCRLLL